jgi:predicted house-cleaning noncanonical NTP pyrophosphatase (MazG superfamily)
MKRNFLLAILLSFPLLFFGQSSSIHFFSSLPNPPGDVCNSRGEERGNYMRLLNPYSDKLNEELKYLTRDEKKNAKRLEDDMTKKMASDFNMSPEEIQRLRNTKKMTQAQKDSIANKMLQQTNMNLSIEEMRDAKKMTKEAKKGWATSIATEQQAEVRSNPSKFNKPDTSNRTANDIAIELSKLQTELGSPTVIVNQKMDEIELDTIRTDRLKEMKRIKLEADTLIGDDVKPGGKKDALMASLRAMQQSYCNEYANKYLQLLIEYHKIIARDLGKYDRIDELVNEQNKKTTGSNVEMMQPGSAAYHAIQQYMDRLLAVYQYSIYDPQAWENYEASKQTGEEGN